MSLSSRRVVSAIAVRDMDAAREFYEGKLGLPAGAERPDGGVRYPCGGGTAIHVYPSPDNAGKSTATLAGFLVDDVASAVDELSARGVSFEQYDAGPIKTDERGIARIGDAVSAWFKDPTGNVLSLNQE
jgi:catechol 2,3-dioxygenase-like lactoylglutathione lyase family enzyme